MKVILNLLFVLLPMLIFGQTKVSGIVIDEETNEALIGAYVINENNRTVADVNGEFELLVDSLPIEITLSFIGFEEEKIFVENKDIGIIALRQNQNVLDIMTVTASKYEKRLSESTVSVEVLKPELISSVNTTNIDAAMDKVPGVQMIDGQANIRGGSGYSYGAGSRVMLLLDDMPALQVDAGFPNWGDIPVENIAQVEVLKGAASALYGSAALNGIINVRTGSPTSVPQTKVSVAYSYFGDLADPTQQWYSDTLRYGINLSLLHKQKLGKLDVVFGGFYRKNESYNRYTFQNRKRANLKLQYQISDKVFVRLNGLVNTGDNGNFFIWSELTENRRYEPYAGNPATSKNSRYFIDPSLHAEDKFGNLHKVLTRIHHIVNDNDDDQSNSSNTLYGEYQFQRRFNKSDIILTAGVVGQTSGTDAELFGDTTFTNNNYALYTQLEKSFGKLNASAGLRYEYNEQLTPEEFDGISIPNGKLSEGKPIARVGLSYEYAPYSAVRASWGQGYRFPTITEKFITTSFGGFNVRPNPLLESEGGWTAEIGVKQAFKFGGLKGYADLSYFTSEYSDMTEFTADLSDLTNIRFSSQNVGDTKINGIDLGIFASADIGEVNISLYGGYTYLDPKYKNFEDSLLRVGLSSEENFLKYRVAHNTKWDVQLGYKGFSFGAAFFHSSHMINIDSPIESLKITLNDGSVLETDIFGVKKFREEHPNGFVRVDLRTSFSYKNAKFSFLVNNIANEEYTERPGIMEAPTNFTFRLDYKIDWK